MDDVYSAVAALAMGSPFLAIVAILVYYYLSRAPWRSGGPRTKSSSGGLEAVLLALTLFYRPRLEYAVEAQHRQAEDADEDDNGDPDTPARHLMRQLRRIRRGESIDRLTIRLW